MRILLLISFFFVVTQMACAQASVIEKQTDLYIISLFKEKTPIDLNAKLDSINKRLQKKHLRLSYSIGFSATDRNLFNDYYAKAYKIDKTIWDDTKRTQGTDYSTYINTCTKNDSIFFCIKNVDSTSVCLKNDTVAMANFFSQYQQTYNVPLDTAGIFESFTFQMPIAKSTYNKYLRESEEIKAALADSSFELLLTYLKSPLPEYKLNAVYVVNKLQAKNIQLPPQVLKFTNLAKQTKGHVWVSVYDVGEISLVQDIITQLAKFPYEK